VELVLSQPVIALDIRVLLRVAGLDKDQCNTLFLAQAASVALMYSGPLSQRIWLGFPRHSTI
jgi:hypothetical protein